MKNKEDEMKQLTIGKLAETACITADTLRYYERMGLVKSSRNKASYRLIDTTTDTPRYHEKKWN